MSLVLPYKRLDPLQKPGVMDEFESYLLDEKEIEDHLLLEEQYRSQAQHDREAAIANVAIEMVQIEGPWALQPDMCCPN
eukprot:12922802-Prorocentrum_lima.AAC.1